MRIGGMQKLTLLDYPGRIACIVFTEGCNFRCPFCHNSHLIFSDQGQEDMTEEKVFTYLKKRRKVLEGVVITGGEPLLWPDLGEFLGEIRKLGYEIKLDTNGSFPGRLKKLLQGGLPDYVALDLKQSPLRYADACGVEDANLVSQIEESFRILRESGVSFEIRTTLVKGIHRREDIRALAKWAGNVDRYYLQSYADSGHVLAPEGLEAFSDQELEEILAQVRVYCPSAVLRK